MPINLNEKIYFSVDYVFSLISEFLEKNGLKASLDDDVDNLENKDSLIDIVFSLTEELAKEKISEEEFVSSLQMQLETSKKTAESILKDVKEKILPFAEKIEPGIEHGEEAQEEIPITIKPVRLINENKNIIGKPLIREIKKDLAEEKPESLRGAGKSLETKKQDVYREPIE